MATKDIEAGEIIVSVPNNFLITDESLIKLYGPHSLSSHQMLALHLVLLSRDKQSWWKPYVDLLPIHFNTMPAKYPKILFDHLPASLKEEVQQQRENIHADYLTCQKFLKSKFPTQQEMSIKEFEWAWLCVNTRCIHMTRSDHSLNGGSIALAPMLDFLNHTTEAKVYIHTNIHEKERTMKRLPLPQYPLD